MGSQEYRTPSKNSSTATGNLFSDVIGSLQSIGGRECIVSRPGDTGHLVYGPYESRSPGRYRVTFDVALDAVPERRKGDFVCATLEVVANGGNTMLAERYLRRAELTSELAPFEVEFTLPEPRELEYRVRTNGQAGLVVTGTPHVESLPGARPLPPAQGSVERTWDNESEFLDGYLRNVTGLIHVGANSGQERRYYRLIGLDVAWVEPIQEVYDVLVDNLAGFRRQRAFKGLLTDKEGETHMLRIANGSGSSSILPLDEHAIIFPGLHYVEQRELTSTTLQALMRREGLSTEHYQALTLDVEGAELMVLKGAGETLRGFRYVKCEVADFPSRVGSPTSADLDAIMAAAGFEQLIRRPFAYGPDGNGTYWDIVWKRKTAGEPLHRPGTSLPMISSPTDTYGMDTIPDA